MLFRVRAIRTAISPRLAIKTVVNFWDTSAGSSPPLGIPLLQVPLAGEVFEPLVEIDKAERLLHKVFHAGGQAALFGLRIDRRGQGH